MGIYSIKPGFQKILTPLTKLLINNKVSPTIINLAGLTLSLIAGVIFYLSSNDLNLLILIPFLTFFRTAFNALDGLVARGMNLKNQGFGEVLNEYLDRLSDSAIFIGLSFTTYTNTVLGLLTLITILLNSYLSILSKAAGGTRQYGGFMGKADRMIYISVASILTVLTKNVNIFNYYLYFTLFGTLVTMSQRFSSIKMELFK
jgi:CDP-diacylglycerol--glycerol-3-phosphate 3-phosphatidyltransferase